MANTDGQIVLGLDIPKTVKQINADIKKLQDQLARIKATGALDTSATVKQINAQITALQSQLKTININAKIDTNNINKTAQQTGTNIAQNIANGISHGVSKARNELKSFTDLTDFTELNKKISNFHVDTSELGNYKTILDEIKNTYSEFGQVKITNEIFKDGVLEKFKVNIEQVNGDLKETKSFMMALNDEKDAFVFSGLISGSESVVQHLDKTKNAVNQTAEAINALKEKTRIDEIQLSIDNGYGASEYQNRINSIIASLEKYGVETKEAQTITASLQSTFDSMKGMSGQELITQADKLEQEFKAVKSSVEQAKLSYDKFMQPVSNEKATSLINKINSFLTKNTKITNDAKVELQGYADELGRGVNLSRWNEINGILKKTENSMRGLGRLGASLKDQMSQAAQSFTQWLSVSSAVMFLVSKTRNAISELKEINTLLTEISKANDKLSKSDLDNIGNNSFDIASRYGKSATDYLSGVQEASRAGYENAEAIAELSVAAQGAGDMTDELANKYIIATDKAYKLGGSVEKLTEVLDGSNYITNHNAVNMTELAEAMSIVGSTAASFGIEANKTTAVLGTMIAATQQSGSEMARAFRAILLNIRQVSDEEEGIDAEGLTKYEKACNALGVSLKETKDGILQTRDAMEVLRDLSVEYNQLEENDLRRTDLLNSVGGKLRANALDAILKNYDMYSKMLDEYAQGAGSMAVEAEKTANSWEGSMNRISNTWKDTIENIVNSDAIITAINGLNSFLSVVNNVTDKLGSLGTIGLSAGLFAGFKNVDYLKTPVCPLYI